MFTKNSFQIIESNQQVIWQLAEVKNYMRIDANYDDVLIASLIEAAIIAAEGFTKLTLVPKKIKLVCNIKNQQHFRLKYHPLKEIKQISLNYGTDEIKLTDTQYYVDHYNARLSLKHKLDDAELQVEYIAGFDAQNVPMPIKQGILLHVTEMYDREGQGDISLSQAIKNLYLPYRQLKI